MKHTERQSLNVVGAILMVAVILPVPGFAQEFSTGYSSESPVSAGMIVSLASQQEKRVEPAHRDNINDAFGVAVNRSESLFTITSQQSDVQVATQGTVKMLVSDINGEISRDDYVTTSAVNGIGMKADETHEMIVGRAREDFAETDPRTIQTAGDDARSISVSRLSVALQIGDNPEAAMSDSPLPGFIQQTADTLAGEFVSPARVIMALVITAGGVVGALVLLYGAVSNTMISLGRNPLSGKSIYAGLLRIILIALGVILISQLVGYVIITA